MKKDKKEYCLTQKEVIEIINREREGGIKAGHEVGVSTVNPENTIKVLENNTVDNDYLINILKREQADKEYLIRNYVEYLSSIGCTPEKYEEVYYEDIKIREKITVEQAKSDINESFTLPGK